MKLDQIFLKKISYMANEMVFQRFKLWREKINLILKKELEKRNYKKIIEIMPSKWCMYIEIMWIIVVMELKNKKKKNWLFKN